jgi:hypothetical protein
MFKLVLLVVSFMFPAHQYLPQSSGELVPVSSTGATLSLLSCAYMIQASCSCFSLFMHLMPCAFVFAFESAGKSMLANMAMIAITTSNSIKVNPLWDRSDFLFNFIFCLSTNPNGEVAFFSQNKGRWRISQIRVALKKKWFYPHSRAELNREMRSFDGRPCGVGLTLV